jgi:hypothetical protein
MGASAPGARAHGIPGYLDPRTGTFTTKAQLNTQSSENFDSALPPLIGEGGTWNINLTLEVYTKPASGDIIVCEATLDVNDTYPSFGFEETGTAQATVSGTAGSCNVSIPYLWYLSTPTKDMVTVSYTVSLFHMFTIGTVTTANISRVSSHIIEVVAIPANGSTTTTTWTPKI